MLRIASTSEPAYEAGKWLTLQMLISIKEMQQLFTHLKQVELFQIATACIEGSEQISQEKFLALYEEYISALATGQIPDMSVYRAFFSSAWSYDSRCLYMLQLAGNKSLVRIKEPVVQTQPLSIGFSSIDNKFRPMVHGAEAIIWGLQFSFPQIFSDPNTKEVLQAKDEGRFINWRLFREIQKWQREHTRPTPFILNGAKHNEPFRLGKDCFAWINNHYQLKHLSLTVAT